MRIETRPLPEVLPALGELPPLLSRLYAARGVLSEAELDRRLQALLPYSGLRGIAQAVAVLESALRERRRPLGRASRRFPPGARRDAHVRRQSRSAARGNGNRFFGRQLERNNAAPATRPRVHAGRRRLVEAHLVYRAERSNRVTA